ncbi:MAG: NDP-sugar synthase, partial [Acidimicrobiales bacterium]|nr:NDP-sugar synthase [Acidimicrobiales bacterium]
FPAIVADGGLWAVQSGAYWVDAGTPQSYIDIQLDLIDGLRGTARQGIADSASVADDAHVVHSVVMAGASVGSGAVVRDSIISVGASVAANAVVDGSIVGPRAVVETGAKLTGLSMLGDGAVAIAGALLDGARIPEVD